MQEKQTKGKTKRREGPTEFIWLGRLESVIDSIVARHRRKKKKRQKKKKKKRKRRIRQAPNFVSLSEASQGVKVI